MNNLNYFEIATEKKEPLIDPDYHKTMEKIIIPPNKESQNKLTISNNNVIRYFQTLETLLYETGYGVDDDEVVEIFGLIIKELETDGMNYSAFCQYFNVHNINYSIFKDLTHEQKIDVLKFIIKPYIENRHRMYQSHGYSDIVLQVMSDNYSHKRKGSYGAIKISNFLDSLNIPNLAESSFKNFEQDVFYLLTDKNGKKLYKKFADTHGIKIANDGKKTVKYPDALIKIGNEIFIIEQKNMKENGGGQDKQTKEITEFIDRNPEINNLHYITYIDGIYFNQIDKNATAKTLQQYEDIVSALTKHPSNYFVNSFAFEKLIKDVLDNHNGDCEKQEMSH